MRFRRILGVAAIAATALAAHGPTEAATPFRVVMIGDSIGNMVFPLVVSPIPGVVHWDAESSRSPYSTGALDRASTVQALATLQRTVPVNTATTRNYIVVIEGAIGDKFGVTIDMPQWQRFIDDVIYWSTNRCLVFVYPGYDDDVNATASALMYQRKVAAEAKFAAAIATGACISTVNWWVQAKVAGCTDPAGLHPSLTGTACGGTSGAQWLADQIERRLVP